MKKARGELKTNSSEAAVQSCFGSHGVHDANHAFVGCSLGVGQQSSSKAASHTTEEAWGKRIFRERGYSLAF